VRHPSTQQGVTVAYAVRAVVNDNKGIAFEVDALPKSFTYDENGNIQTITVVEAGTVVRVKTFTHEKFNGVWLIETESPWVLQ
jgi:hypothetical protein